MVRDQGVGGSNPLSPTKYFGVLSVIPSGGNEWVEIRQSDFERHGLEDFWEIYIHGTRIWKHCPRRVHASLGQAQQLRSAPSNLGDRRPISLRFSASRRQALPTASFGEWPNRGRSRRSWLGDVFGTMPKDA